MMYVNIYYAVTTFAILVSGAFSLFVWLKKGRKWLTKHVDLRVQRLELMFLITNYPEKKETIHNSFDEYIKLGGNSYIKEFYND